MKLRGDYPLLRVAGLLGDDVGVDFNRQRQQVFFPVVDLRELKDKAVELSEGGL